MPAISLLPRADHVCAGRLGERPAAACSRRSNPANSVVKLPESLRASPPTDTTVGDPSAPGSAGIIRSHSRRRRTPSDPSSRAPSRPPRTAASPGSGRATPAATPTAPSRRRSPRRRCASVDGLARSAGSATPILDILLRVQRVHRLRQAGEVQVALIDEDRRAPGRRTCGDAEVMTPSPSSSRRGREEALRRRRPAFAPGLPCSLNAPSESSVVASVRDERGGVVCAPCRRACAR